MYVLIRTIALFVLFQLQTSVGTKCPPSQVILPCSCAEYINHISCWNIKSDVDLKQIFYNLTKFVGKNVKQLIYDEFKLIDSELSHLGNSESDDFFNGVAFNKITITKNNKLQRIHKNAFKSSFNTTTHIFISENRILGNEPPNQREIFDFLNSFESVKEISLTDNNITIIPDKAFSRPQKFLNRLSLIDNNIVSIGAQAFTSLSALNYLILDGNRIDKISNMAFELPENDQRFLLFLRDNDLSDESFQSGTFEKINRVITLDLSRNNITHLKKSVFAPLFRRKGSSVSLRNNPLICDCNFKWLYDRRLLYNSSSETNNYFVYGIQCNGTKHQKEKNNELLDIHFRHCPHEDSIDCFFSSESEYDYYLCLNSAKTFFVITYIPILLINIMFYVLLIQ